MSKGPNHTGRMDPRDAVVTYSRLPSSSRRREKAPAGRREPTLDAAEIHLMDAQEGADSAFTDGPPDLRADPVAPDSIRRGRAGSARFVLFGASLAVLAGVGVLAATVGTATIVPKGVAVEEASGAPPPLELTRSDAAADQAAPSDVRKIPLSAGEEVPAAAAAEADPEADATPPVPRPRPEVATASAEPGPDTASQPSASASGSEPRPTATMRPATTSAEPQPAPRSQASSEGRGSPGGTDALILSIEETLAKIDSNEPSGPSGASGSVSQPPVLPPPASPPSALSAPLAPYPPVEDGYPSSAGMAGSQDGPYYDVMPPAPPRSYGQGTPSGPVPPEPVPYVYPPSPIAYPPGYVEVEPQERKRGIVGRTIARTVDVVERVFSRD